MCSLDVLTCAEHLRFKSKGGPCSGHEGYPGTLPSIDISFRIGCERHTCSIIRKCDLHSSEVFCTKRVENNISNTYKQLGEYWTWGYFDFLDHKHKTLKELVFLLQELTQKISEMKEKAEQSEVMVQEICRDIKKLDCAKKHITTTITALHRLAMLGLLKSPLMHNTYTCPNICSAAVNSLRCPARIGDGVRVYFVIIQLTSCLTAGFVQLDL